MGSSLSVLIVVSLTTPALALAAPDKDAEVAAVLGELWIAVPKGFRADVPPAYMPDSVTPEKIEKNPKAYPFRAAVVNAVETLSFARRPPVLTTLRDPDSAARGLKQAVQQAQEQPARTILKLDETIRDLTTVLKSRDKEPSARWRAHAEYALAEARFRMVLAHEYDHALGNIRIGAIPELKKDKGENGVRLARVEKLSSKKEVKDMAEEAKRLLAEVIKTHPGTPWAMIADMRLKENMGMVWEPAVLPDPPKPKTKDAKKP
ncbi:hypothetical protein [Fimbriiglobus ruber]|uniref:Uncharacterized protein n=1 Tax=Fimbriiglobus ruber TaxID=1908690 RepID=A0A225DRF6_9BACT|nr:hypothetical protein [Fimbriiglobus ruber]OWK39729.1 hypothetical protein FRUB_05619 [Fimbriiglobus ruber]